MPESELAAEGQDENGDWSFHFTPRLGVPEMTKAATHLLAQGDL